MRIEILHLAGCASASETLAIVKEKTQLLAPEAEIEAIQLDPNQTSSCPGFYGSPSVLVDGIDLEGLRGPPTGATQRFYVGSGRVPSVWMVEAGILRALAPKHILFLCVANSARSQMAEGIARSLASDRAKVSSAGSQPTALRNEAIHVLWEIGIHTGKQRAKGIDEIDMESVDAVITLCEDEICPYFPRPVPQIHWALPDPAAVKGNKEKRLASFRQVRDELQRRLKILLIN